MRSAATGRSISPWTEPTDNGGADVISYILQRRDANANYVTLANPAATATTYTHRALSDNTQYSYQLIAVNKAGNSLPSADSATTVLTQPSVPSAPLPAADQFDDDAGEVTLFWLPPAFNAQTVTRYEYRYKDNRSTSSYGGWQTVSTDPTITTVTVEVEPLFPAVSYTFQVRARNSTGPGTQYLEIMATPAPTEPTAAPSLSTTLGAVDDAPQISFSFDVLGASVNGGAAISSYLLQVTIVAKPRRRRLD